MSAFIWWNLPFFFLLMVNFLLPRCLQMTYVLMDIVTEELFPELNTVKAIIDSRNMQNTQVALKCLNKVDPSVPQLLVVDLVNAQRASSFSTSKQINCPPKMGVFSSGL